MRINLDKKKGNFYILTWRREIKEEEEKKIIGAQALLFYVYGQHQYKNHDETLPTLL